MATQFKLRRDTAANWASANPVLADGELGVDTTNKKFKLGDGSTAWNSLPVYPSLTAAEQAALVAGKLRAGGTSGGAATTVFIQSAQPTANAVGDLWFY